MNVRRTRLLAVLAVGAIALMSTACQPKPPTAQPPTGTPVQLDVSITHGCAVYSTGTIRCWGNNRDGQLGNGTRANKALRNVAVSGITNARSVTVGDFSTCALLSNRTVKCWGNGIAGRLGNGSETGSTVPITVAGLTGVTSVSMGDSGYPATCATLTTGQVSCWGSNVRGLLGSQSIPFTIKGWRGTPAVVPGISGATSVSLGRDNACTLLGDHTVKCWGDNQSGQVGNASVPSGTGSAMTSIPTTVVGLTGVSRLSAGNGHNCAQVGTAARCWGSNWTGQRGTGDILAPTAPSTVSGGHVFTKVTAGGASCGIEAHQAYCWGPDNAARTGQIGNPSVPNPPPADAGKLKPPYTTVPLPVTVVSGTFTLLENGDGVTCGALTTKAIRCWGSTNYGATVTGIG